MASSDEVRDIGQYQGTTVTSVDRVWDSEDPEHTDQAGRVISTLEQTFCPFAGLGCWELFHLGGMLVYMEDLSTFFRDIYFFLSKYFSISCSYFHVINCHRVLFQTSTVKTLGNSSNQDLKFSVSLVL